ncbi:MAG: RNA-binding protein [Promethearchaeota archaeon]|nr:MAG: RNA-binding protein [Candidatus Lokiarchaeota archaeon]
MISKEKFKSKLLDPPDCILGKRGISNEFLEHVRALIKQNKIIKVKALKSIAKTHDIEELAHKLAEKTDTLLVDMRGKTFILSKYPVNR